MRPSNETGVVAVLDTLPECKVVLDAMYDREFMQANQQPDAPIRDRTAFRFRMQTRHEIPPMTADTSAETTWKPSPEFKIETQDVAFIAQAAHRTLHTKNSLDRLVNRCTRRTAAAKTILRTLSTDL